ncbi:MAG: hypothetical protein LBB88_02720 [Planctomycetaceae bacterium]|jgi:hypothetical protein|nr:hypothetical protein [Planctomycetaceae bacterium]
MDNVIFVLLTALCGLVISSLIGMIFFAIRIYFHSISRCVKLQECLLSSCENKIFQKADEWACSNGFHFVGIFRFRLLLFAGWENPEKSSILIQKLNFFGNYFEIDTLLDNKICVETGNLSDEIILPSPPGFYIQQFSKKSLDETWELHNKAIQYLTEFGGVHLTPFCPDLKWGNLPSTDPLLCHTLKILRSSKWTKKDINKTLAESEPSAVEILCNSFYRSRTKYIRSLYFFPLRWLFYWSFYRWIFCFNKTIQEQIEKRQLVLPQELSIDYEKYFIRWSPKKKSKNPESKNSESNNPESEESNPVSPTESNINENKNEKDSKSLYSRDFSTEIKVQKKGFDYWISCVISWTIIIVIWILFLPPLIDYPHKGMNQILQLLATENYEEALEKSIVLNRSHRKIFAISLVAKEYASAGRYDDALKTMELLKEYEDNFHMKRSYDEFINCFISAKAADEQFDGLDELARQVQDMSIQQDTYANLAISKAKAGLIDDAQKTLQQLNNAEYVKLRLTQSLLKSGQTNEAIAFVKSIQLADKNELIKTECLCELAKNAAEKNDVETARQLLFNAVEISDQFEKKGRYHFLKILRVFRLAGKPDEGLRFVQEISARYSDDEKNKKENKTTFSMNDYIFFETALLNVELGKYAEGWKTLTSIKSLFENFISPLSFERIFLLREFFQIGQKHNFNMEAEIKYIENLVKPTIDANAADSKIKIRLLERLFDFQLVAGCFDDAIATAQKCKKIKKESYDFESRIAEAQVNAGKIEDALKTAKKNKLSYGSWEKIILAEAKADRFDAAVKHLSNTSQYRRISTLSEIIQIRIDKGQLAESEKMLEKNRRSLNVSDKINLLLSLSEGYFDLGNKNDAERLLSQAIPLMDKNLISSWESPKPDQFLRISKMLSKLGRFDEALKSAERISIIRVSKRVEALQSLSDAQSAAGKLEEAKITQEKIKWKFAKLKKKNSE